MSRFGHAQFSQPIRVLPDTIDQSEYLMSKPITIENPRPTKLFKFKPETLICVTLNSKNSCSMTMDLESFELSIDLLPVKTLTSGCTKNVGILSEINEENHGTLMIYFMAAES